MSKLNNRKPSDGQLLLLIVALAVVYAWLVGPGRDGETSAAEMDIAEYCSTRRC